MRRHARAITLIAVLAIVSGLILGFQTIKIGGFERGDDTPLGLKLGLDLQGGIHLVYQPGFVDPETDERSVPSKENMTALRRAIEQRANRSGLGEPEILLLGEDRLVVRLPGISDLERAKSIIGETADLQFKHRKFSVAEEIEGLDPEDILSVALDAVPEETMPAPDAGVGEDEAAQPSETTVSVEGGTAELETKETPAGAEATQAEPVQGEESDKATEDSERATASEPAGGETQEAPPEEQEEEIVLAPVLVVEFTEKGAKAFARMVDGLLESEENLTEDGQFLLDLLEVSVEGKESRTISVSYSRLTQFGPLLIPVESEPQIKRIDGTNSFTIRLSGIQTVEEAENIFGDEIKVSFKELLGKDDDDVGLSGKDLARAYPGQHQATGEPIVNIEFKEGGARIFGELTAKIAGTGERIAIFLDGEELIAPQADRAITGGAAFISGQDFTIERVRDISLLLEAGALPIPMGDPIMEREVGPSLGSESLKKSVLAGLVGLGLVFLFMTIYYRAPGLVAAAALLIYGGIFLAIFKILPVTLTLSGVAAAVLSVGMAVDANILIFERMKEELRVGRTLLTSINIGFNRAWPAIRDGNVSTLITCAILFWFADQLGATLVQGFAAALAIGVAISMFSAITVSRTLLRLLAETRLSRRLEMFAPAGGADLPQEPAMATARRS